LLGPALNPPKTDFSYFSHSVTTAAAPTNFGYLLSLEMMHTIVRNASLAKRLKPCKVGAAPPVRCAFSADSHSVAILIRNPFVFPYTVFLLPGRYHQGADNLFVSNTSMKGISTYPNCTIYEGLEPNKPAALSGSLTGSQFSGNGSVPMALS
jgi:hypothetical protein